MIQLESLSDVADYIHNNHKFLFASKGAIGYKWLRRRDGSRILLESMHGFTMQEIIVHENNLIIKQRAQGIVFKSNRKHTFDATLYLQDLKLVNFYSFSAEFFTTESIDFTYINNNKSTSLLMLSTLICGDLKDLKAQWYGDGDLTELLSEIGTDKKIKRSVSLGRNIDLREEL